MDLPQSYTEARALKAKGWPDGLPLRFFTGKPCKRGHFAERNLDGTCVMCKRVVDNALAKTERWRSKANAYNREYTKRPENLAQTRAYVAAGRAARLRATPPWLTDAQRAEIKAFYDDAKRRTEVTGIVHEVDHIEPLRGKGVCGWHVPWNLRVIPATENRRKSNR